MHNTPLEWVSDEVRLADICIEIEQAMSVHNVLAIDLEYHSLQKQATVLSLI